MATRKPINTERDNMASEPMAIYGEVNAPKTLRSKETFEQQWQRSLTVEDFRKRCKQKLHTIYG